MGTDAPGLLDAMARRLGIGAMRCGGE